LQCHRAIATQRDWLCCPPIGWAGYQPPLTNMTNQPPQLQPGRYKNKRCSQDDKIISPLSLCAPVRQDWLVDTMYKHQSPEALHLASLGRADSKRPETTCRGITTAGKACRKPLKKGSRDKYCHLHLDQQTAYRSKPLRAKEMTVTIVTEVDEEEVEQEMRVAKTVVSNGLFTPMASPKQLSPAMKPVPSGSMVSPRPGLPPPSLQLCQRPIIPPPTPPHSVHRVTPMSDKLSYNKEKKQFFKLARAFGKLFIDDSPTSTPAIAGRPARDPPAWPVDVPLNDRYPSTHQPPGLPPSPPKIHTPPSPTPARPPIPPAHQHRIPVRHPTKPKVRVPQTQGRPPTVVLASAQSTSAITGVQRSWDTMWVPGIDGYGAHIICKGLLPQLFRPLTAEWLSPNLSAAGSQKILNCMRAPLSAGEEPGYIYVYKISGTVLP